MTGQSSGVRTGAAAAIAVVVGVAAGVAAISVHRSAAGLVLGVGAAVVTIWALRWWPGPAALGFAGGWLVSLVTAVAGRGEGDYVVSSDTLGWSLIGSGFLVLVLGILAAGPGRTRRRSDGSPPAT